MSFCLIKQQLRTASPSPLNIWQCLENFTGCHNWERRCYWPRHRRGQGSFWTFYNAQDSPHSKELCSPNADSAEAEKLLSWDPSTALGHGVHSSQTFYQHDVFSSKCELLTSKRHQNTIPGSNQMMSWVTAQLVSSAQTLKHWTCRLGSDDHQLTSVTGKLRSYPRLCKPDHLPRCLPTHSSFTPQYGVS